MAVHRIIVDINEQQQNYPTQPSNFQQATQPAPQPEVKQGELTVGKILGGAAIFNMGKSIALGSVARIGAATGNYYQQKQITNAMSLANYALAIAAKPGLGLALVALDIGFKVYDFNLERDKNEIRVDLYREAVGLSALSGTRYRGRKI